ncbi:bacteriophage holin [Haloarchaeobius baliensis]|uniref:bacteriophage holin n=1 Tax=Haloarchaeobius baliensis TaxID=1670458 RepID=UPI003F88037F
MATTRLDSSAFGLACGLLWSAAVVLLGITARIGWGRRWERLLADVYRGYDESGSGLLVGALWAFLDGFLGGYAFAALYNRLRRVTGGRPRVEGW